MKKLLLLITILFTVVLGGCGEKRVPFEEVHNYVNSDGTKNPEKFIMKGYKKNGILDGEIDYYDLKTKKLNGKEFFKDGEIYKRNFYHENGNIYSEGLFKKNKLHEIQTYYEDGKTIHYKKWYKNGELIKTRYYNKDGSFDYEDYED